jgi:hypothetical protein
MYQSPQERSEVCPAVYHQANLPTPFLSDRARSRLKLCAAEQARNETGVGGTATYLDTALRSDDYRVLIKRLEGVIQSLVDKDTLHGKRIEWLTSWGAPWFLRYTSGGHWHTDSAYNARIAQRSWSIVCVLESKNSSFEITNSCGNIGSLTQTKKFDDAVVIFPGHWTHRGHVKRGGVRAVIAASFKLV